MAEDVSTHGTSPSGSEALCFTGGHSERWAGECGDQQVNVAGRYVTQSLAELPARK